jgi:hypothetical protein
MESQLNQSLAEAQTQTDAPALAPEAMEAAVPFEPPPAETPAPAPQMELGFEAEQAAKKTA